MGTAAAPVLLAGAALIGVGAAAYAGLAYYDHLRANLGYCSGAQVGVDVAAFGTTVALGVLAAGAGPAALTAGVGYLVFTTPGLALLDNYVN